MTFRYALAVLLTLAAESTLTASQTYDFGLTTTVSLSDESTAYTGGAWTAETYSGSTTQQIDCVVAFTGGSSTSDVCGTSGTNLGSAANVTVVTAPGGTNPTGSNYLMVDGDPHWGAPISTVLSLTAGDSYTLSFYQASNEESPDNTAYDDSWQVYLIPGSTAANICPQSYCTTHAAQTVVDSGDLVHTSAVMHNTGGTSTSWVQDTYTFTASATSEVLEFVTNVLLPGTPDTVPTGSSFQPPMLDLADVTLTQNSSTPEPSTWELTMLGAGVVFAVGKLRRRFSGRK
jgi:hypothetical protein